MAQQTEIAWCDSTWNPWQGCTKVSPGCQACYAEARDQRFAGGAHWGKGAPRVRSKNFDAPLAWNKKPWICDACGEARGDCAAHLIEGCGRKPARCSQCDKVTTFHRRRVFSLSLGDWLDDEVPIEWLADALDVIRRCPNLDFILLTKRPESWRARVFSAYSTECDLIDHGQSKRRDMAIWLEDWINETPPANVWIGATCENQEWADKRIPELLKIPAVCRFISYEPALGPIEFSNVSRRSDAVEQLGKQALAGIHQIIVGGESGPHARPFNVGWARSTVAQCKAASVACFVKQMGAFPTDGDDYAPFKLKDKKGGNELEWPADLRVRQFPMLK